MRPRVLQDASNPPRETPEEASKRLHKGNQSPSSDHLLSNQPNLRVKDNQNHSIHTVLSKITVNTQKEKKRKKKKERKKSKKRKNETKNKER
jgi:hypothetical protein